ncbi:patatin-like phospholipase family protein [Paenibacillus sp. NPDC057886]|uniref:patatin-like phospholipase family protein n=1 Tax=Paenibacillus sp. NPDC057886 TaxID=3346270 RepID=UPI00369614E3
MQKEPLPQSESDIQENVVPKMGLALSGGGFRASYFHLGVLRSLAKKDLLRHVEVISTVSGGTIIGVLYYLELKKLIEEKYDHEILPEDYLQIVKNIETEFYKFTSKNIRMLSFLDVMKNTKIEILKLKILLLSNIRYTRTNYIGELFEEHLYKKFRSEDTKLRVKDLRISPKGTSECPINKIPSLVINTTCLNNGAGFFITSEKSYLKHPKNSISKSAQYKGDIHTDDMLLSDIISASASVPGIFQPISVYLPELEISHSLFLVDGGVFDNQGIEALLDKGCNYFIISDGSKPLDFKFYPLYSRFGSLFKTNDILMNRNRNHTIDNLYMNYPDTVVFPHLLYGVDSHRFYPKDDWEDYILNPSSQSDIKTEEKVFPYGYLEYISKIRTDLDAFTETEAYGLSYCGMKICDNAVNNNVSLSKLINDVPEKYQFDFDQFDALIKSEMPSSLQRQFEVGQSRLFKWPKILKKSAISTKVMEFLTAIMKSPFLLSWFILIVLTSNIVKVSITVGTTNPYWKFAVFLYPFIYPIIYGIIIFIFVVVRSFIIFIFLKTINKWYLRVGNLDHHK